MLPNNMPNSSLMVLRYNDHQICNPDVWTGGESILNIFVMCEQPCSIVWGINKHNMESGLQIRNISKVTIEVNPSYLRGPNVFQLSWFRNPKTVVDVSFFGLQFAKGGLNMHPIQQEIKRLLE